jgi:hypothetical protein
VLALTVLHRRNPSNTQSRASAFSGGGTAGYFAALSLKKRFPTLAGHGRRVRPLFRSSAWARRPRRLMPPFLHKQLGIDIVELYEDVRPTWKLGIKFDWGQPAITSSPIRSRFVSRGRVRPRRRLSHTEVSHHC